MFNWRNFFVPKKEWERNFGWMWSKDHQNPNILRWNFFIKIPNPNIPYPSWSNPIILRSFVFGLQDLVPKTRSLRALDWKGPSTGGSTVNRGGYQSLEPLSCVGLEYQNFDIKLGGECTTDCNSGGNCLHPTASRLELQRCRFDNA